MRLFCLSVVFLSVIVNSQVLPDTIWIPVTFYDFHSDGSNPEFEIPHAIGIYKGMVDSLLDKDNKPQLGPTPYLNHHIKYWYQLWDSEKGGQGDFTIPLYNCINKCDNVFQSEMVFDSISDVPHDTAFKNLVLEDSLPFVYNEIENHYEYFNDNFFPLDNIGFGNEMPNRSLKRELDHNFSFTMELHHTFTKLPGLHFNFRGDDDVWVFINSRLVLELGGIHSEVDDSFDLDTFDFLENGKQYQLSFFFAERHTQESHIHISTNIFKKHTEVESFRITCSDTIQAGETFSICIANTENFIPWLNDKMFEYKILSSGINSTHFKESQNFKELLFSPTKAYCTDVVEISLHANDLVLKDTIYIETLPGAPGQLTIESSIPEPQDSKPINEYLIDTLKIRSHDDSISLYAVIRDIFGNFIRLASANWTVVSGDSSIIYIPDDLNSWEAVISGGKTFNTTEIACSSSIYDGDNFKYTTFIINDIPVSALKPVKVAQNAISIRYKLFNLCGQMLKKPEFTHPKQSYHSNGVYIKVNNENITKVPDRILRVK